MTLATRRAAALERANSRRSLSADKSFSDTFQKRFDARVAALGGRVDEARSYPLKGLVGEFRRWAKLGKHFDKNDAQDVGKLANGQRCALFFGLHYTPWSDAELAAFLNRGKPVMTFEGMFWPNGAQK